MNITEEKRRMNPLLRQWLDIKNDEFNHKGYSSQTIDALQEFANYITAQQIAPAFSGTKCDCGNPSGRTYEASICWDCDRINA